MPLRARLKTFTFSDPLPRSSHSFNVLNGTAFLFGGEIQPRQPVNDSVYTISLKKGAATMSADELKPRNLEGTSEVTAPEARVGHAAAIVGDELLLFGGRGGADMNPLKENGRVWSFSTLNRSWSALDPSTSSLPEERSYHSATSSKDTFFIHAGCPASGRASDLWSFKPKNRTWKQLASAPAPPRGGPGFTYAAGKLWRYGGFDGKQELGGKLDYLDVSNTSSETQAWESKEFAEAECPGPRSVTGLLGCKALDQDYLVAIMGERDASSLGHEGAGMFWDDVWALEISKDGKPADSWTKCEITEDSDKPSARGWFASDKLDDETLVVYGGLNGKNERESNGFTVALVQ